jgi:serine/threonine protein kinase
MLTGGLPFSAADPMEWVHCHIARKPLAPTEWLESVPGPISDLVMKLLAKTAEDRYQTATGLKHDLHRCLWATGISSRLRLASMTCPTGSRFLRNSTGESERSRRCLPPSIAWPSAAGRSWFWSLAISSKHDVAHSAIVRQHADDDAAAEQVGNVGCRPQAERSEFTDPLGATDIRNDLAA